MKHIHQIGTEEPTYITVKPELYCEWDGKKSIEHKFDGELEQHPSIVNHPDLFEIVEENPPEKTHWLNYQLPPVEE